MGHWASRYSEREDGSPLRLLVIQPTPFCNIDCRYCYLADRHRTDRIELDTFRAILERLGEDGLYGNELTILWHGGEPLTVPLSFYREAYRLCRAMIPAECRFRFNFQTNATLISAEFCDFALEIDAHVGISIDGPRDLTDAARLFRSGRGAYSTIMTGIDLLRESGVPYSAICVLRSESLDHPDRIFDFFVGLGVEEVGFNIEEIEGANRSSSLLHEPDGNDRYKAFLRVIDARRRAEAPAVRFRDLSQVEQSIRLGSDVFSRLVNPFSIISVAYDGSWSTFAPELLYEPRYRFGNVRDGGFAAATLIPAFADACADIQAGVEKCRAECDYFGLCGGGSPSNKVAEVGSARVSETLHCRIARKALIDVALEELESRYALT